MVGPKSLAELILNVLWSSGLSFLDSQRFSSQQGAGKPTDTAVPGKHLKYVAGLHGKQFKWNKWTCSEKWLVFTFKVTILLPKGTQRGAGGKSVSYVFLLRHSNMYSFFIFTRDCIAYIILNFLFWLSPRSGSLSKLHFPFIVSLQFFKYNLLKRKYIHIIRKVLKGTMKMLHHTHKPHVSSPQRQPMLSVSFMSLQKYFKHI